MEDETYRQLFSASVCFFFLGFFGTYKQLVGGYTIAIPHVYLEDC